MLFCLVFAFIVLSISFFWFKKEIYLNALYLKLYGIIALTVVSLLFISKFTNYQFLFDADFDLYLQLQHIKVHPYIIRNVQTICHTLYLSSTILFLSRYYKNSVLKNLLISLPLILFLIVNTSYTADEISFQIFSLAPQNQQNVFLIVDMLLSGITFLIVLVYVLIPIALIVKKIINTPNVIKRNFFTSYLACMILTDILYFSMFIFGLFQDISPHRLGLNNIPSNVSIYGNIFTSSILLTTVSVIITILIIVFKPFKAKKLNIEYASTKHFQKFQYDNYYTTLHMLKNTLLCVYKYIEISEKHIDNSKAITSLTCAKEQINEQLENYNNIMAHFKTKNLKFEPINVIKIINNSINNAEIENTITIKKDYDPEMVINIMGNSASIDQVCKNIIENAMNSLKLSSRENKQISVSVIDDDDYVVIGFTNNGNCIPKEHQKFLFNLFFSTHANEFCSGIGLYYVKEIVTRHNGDIWFKSTPEQTTFTIALPIIK